ncbi:bifunctional adenosylcobinamide kinase/adenosylcobinamide-phosphate guanylyltransferase [Bacillus tuaregi]|uniref:bifunctional adenosylcobinamide kinase/adenosylcobinamide-phosphate guanylyltransferase n=1 Tax=Bacillus tuaregi TaxID=1816695 RepID=UPI0008F8DDE4|nr:bifunctional adenosylcobinamide kinase/adenosylcobinamide-phosphate guanylyltransferase [Bacillus tuaregi]
MHFVTGGAFNGKSKWVKAYNQLTKENNRWISAYQHENLPDSLDSIPDILVLEGIEHWVKVLLKHQDEGAVREKWYTLLQQWKQWEKGKPGRMVTLIGSDLTKGIVPATLEERVWRDVTGRVFQEIAAASDRVDLIWYGMNQRIK